MRFIISYHLTLHAFFVFSCEAASVKKLTYSEQQQL